MPTFQEFSVNTLSLNQIKSLVPKVNLRKIKLNGFENLYKFLASKNITTISLDEKLSFISLPSRKKEAETPHKATLLRKKIEKEEVSGDITFNLEAQITPGEEKIIFSPEITQEPKEQILSVSGMQEEKPSQPKEEIKEKKKDKSKKKPYFIAEKETIKPAQETSFPWSAQAQEYKEFGGIFQESLESQLLDTETVKEETTKITKKEIEKTAPEEAPFKVKAALDQDLELFYGDKSAVSDTASRVFLKAILSETTIKPQFPNNIDTIPKETMLGTPSFLGSIIAKGGVEWLKKVNKMPEKFKFTPFRLALLGGLTATLGYLVWNNNFNISNEKSLDSDKVVVRDILKKTHTLKKTTDLKETKESKEELGFTFKPITEKERLALIQKAREAIESRLDPFGQEIVIKSSPIAKELAEKKLPPPEINLGRKQVELVGVINMRDKNLALVNVYTAEYTVMADDEKTVRDQALKTALGMAVPNRMEVSLLDPVEDWFVKEISKSKGRGEDPWLELVREDKKFKLKVGQKVLLPEEKTFDQVKQEVLEARQKLLGEETKTSEKSKV